MSRPLKKECEECCGTGKEICNNPDHGFINAMPGEVGRLGCPVCGHDDMRRVPNSICAACNGSGFEKSDFNDCHDAFVAWLSSDEVREGIVKAIYKKRSETIMRMAKDSSTHDLADAVIKYLTGGGKDD